MTGHISLDLGHLIGATLTVCATIIGSTATIVWKASAWKSSVDLAVASHQKEMERLAAAAAVQAADVWKHINEHRKQLADHGETLASHHGRITTIEDRPKGSRH